MNAHGFRSTGRGRGRCRPNRRSSRAFTVMETTLATIIVGLAVLSIVKLITAVTQQNFYAQKTTTAEMLANNMRELMAGMPFNDPATGTHLGPDSGETSVSQYNDVEDFNGFTANPPIDAQRQPINGLPDWQQSVTVTHISPNNYGLTDSLPTDSACVLDRVKVVVSYRPPGSATWIQIVSMEWLKAKL